LEVGDEGCGDVRQVGVGDELGAEGGHAQGRAVAAAVVEGLLDVAIRG
jgi:hypothetical protein